MQRLAARLVLLLALAAAGLAGPAAAQSTVGDLISGAPEDSSAAPEEAQDSPETAPVEPMPEGMPPAALSLPGGPDYDQWESVASRAEQVLEAERASSRALEEMRDRLAAWRSTFNDAQNANSDQIKRLRAQLEALGPAPGEGESEAAMLAAAAPSWRPNCRAIWCRCAPRKRHGPAPTG